MFYDSNTQFYRKFLLFITTRSFNVCLNYYTSLRLENNCKNTMNVVKFTMNVVKY